MFRVSQYLQEVKSPTPLGPKRNPPGPVVIWNLIRRCNLACQHCYSISADIDFPGELATAEIFRTMDDLRTFGVPVLILSGGERRERSRRRLPACALPAMPGSRSGCASR